MPMVGAISGNGIQPGAAHLVQLVETMERDKIKIVATHPFYDEKVARLVAIGADLSEAMRTLQSNSSRQRDVGGCVSKCAAFRMYEQHRYR